MYSVGGGAGGAAGQVSSICSHSAATLALDRGLSTP